MCEKGGRRWITQNARRAVEVQRRENAPEMPHTSEKGGRGAARERPAMASRFGGGLAACLGQPRVPSRSFRAVQSARLARKQRVLSRASSTLRVLAPHPAQVAPIARSRPPIQSRPFRAASLSSLPILRLEPATKRRPSLAPANAHLHNSPTPRHRQQRKRQQAHVHSKRRALGEELAKLPRMNFELLELERPEAEHSPVVVSLA